MSDTQQRHGSSPTPWRTGRKVGRTIYDADDHDCEVCDGTALALASDREGEALGPGDILVSGEESLF